MPWREPAAALWYLPPFRQPPSHPHSVDLGDKPFAKLGDSREPASRSSSHRRHVGPSLLSVEPPSLSLGADASALAVATCKPPSLRDASAPSTSSAAARRFWWPSCPARVGEDDEATSLAGASGRSAAPRCWRLAGGGSRCPSTVHALRPLLHTSWASAAFNIPGEAGTCSAAARPAVGELTAEEHALGPRRDAEPGGDPGR